MSVRPEGQKVGHLKGTMAKEVCQLKRVGSSYEESMKPLWGQVLLALGVEA